MHRFHNYVINLFILLILLSGKVVLSQSQIIDSEKKIIEFLEILKKMMEKCNEKGLITVESTSVIQFE